MCVLCSNEELHSLVVIAVTTMKLSSLTITVRTEHGK